VVIFSQEKESSIGINAPSESLIESIAEGKFASESLNDYALSQSTI